MNIGRSSCMRSLPDMDFSAGKNTVGCTGTTAAVAHYPLLLATTDIIAQIVTDTAAVPSRYRLSRGFLLYMGAKVFKIRNGHTTSIAPHPARSVKLSGVGPG